MRSCSSKLAKVLSLLTISTSLLGSFSLNSQAQTASSANSANNNSAPTAPTLPGMPSSDPKIKLITVNCDDATCTTNGQLDWSKGKISNDKNYSDYTCSGNKNFFGQNVIGIDDYKDGIMKKFTKNNPDNLEYLQTRDNRPQFRNCDYYQQVARIAPYLKTSCNGIPMESVKTGEEKLPRLQEGQFPPVGMCSTPVQKNENPNQTPVFAYQFRYNKSFGSEVEKNSNLYRDMTGMEGNYDGVGMTYTYYTYQKDGQWTTWENPNKDNIYGGWLVYGVGGQNQSSNPDPKLQIVRKTKYTNKDLYNLVVEKTGSNTSNTIKITGKILNVDGFTPVLKQNTSSSRFKLEYTDVSNTGKKLIYENLESSDTYVNVSLSFDIPTEDQYLYQNLSIDISNVFDAAGYTYYNSGNYVLPWFSKGTFRLEKDFMSGDTKATASVYEFEGYNKYTIEKAVGPDAVTLTVKLNVIGDVNQAYPASLKYVNETVNECKLKDYTILVIDHDGSQLMNKKCSEAATSQPVVALKPVIYAYPTKETNINFKVDYKGDFAYTYPTYSRDTGWNMKVKPDGEMTAKDGNKYPYLFWEGKKYDLAINKNEGFVVKKEDVNKFLEEKLTYLGLNYREKTDFITFWAPKMMEKNYYYINFANKQFDEMSPLTVTPKPDSIQRIFMVFEGLDKPKTLTEQKLEKFERFGYSVIEWGGSVLNN